MLLICETTQLTLAYWTTEPHFFLGTNLIFVSQCRVKIHPWIAAHALNMILTFCIRHNYMINRINALNDTVKTRAQV